MTVLLGLITLSVAGLPAQERRAARDLGVVVGVLPPGPLNAITDVGGVLVGHRTVVSGDSINTGVTAILPHSGNVFQEKVPAAVVIGNAFGKLAGSTQVQELGELESPVVLTCTLCVPRAADAVLTYLLALPGNENVQSANPVVGETNDGFLNHIRLRPISESDVLAAIDGARSGPVEQGSVGAGRGTRAFGWKGGIGTSSRRLPVDLGGWTVGVLVQSNFGGVLSIVGAPVGQELARHYLQGQVDARGIGGTADGRGGKTEKSAGGLAASPGVYLPRVLEADSADGSIMIVVATDAPLDHRNLERLGRRALAGLARTGSSMSNGSGDFVVVFSTIPVAQLAAAGPVPNDRMSPLFQGVIEATEEAIYNSLFLATTVSGHRGTVEALPLEATLEVLRRFGVLQP
ncbi:MAG: aminopeptidase [Gemmatimonas sp. SG8_17]|nr:MAG: aminopeptidase [Gemmatimonas sp. SG8_17]